MDAKGIRRRRTEPRDNSALVLTVLGFVLFAQGMIYLVDDAPFRDQALGAFKLAGWFATAGWLTGHLHRPQSTLARWVRVAFLRVQAVCRIPADGILEMLLCGLFFIVLLVLGMVSLWSTTIR